MQLSPGSRLGPDRIVAPIRKGGMGEVCRARDTRLPRDVAVKILPAELARDAERLQRFEQESRAAAALNHPNVLVVFDVGVEQDLPYVVSELLEGETLSDALAGGPLSLRTRLETAVRVASGMAAAHESGIVHRDLQPSNIFITTDGRRRRRCQPCLRRSSADSVARWGVRCRSGDVNHLGRTPGQAPRLRTVTPHQLLPARLVAS